MNNFDDNLKFLQDKSAAELLALAEQALAMLSEKIAAAPSATPEEINRDLNKANRFEITQLVSMLNRENFKGAEEILRTAHHGDELFEGHFYLKAALSFRRKHWRNAAYFTRKGIAFNPNIAQGILGLDVEPQIASVQAKLLHEAASYFCSMNLSFINENFKQFLGWVYHSEASQKDRDITKQLESIEELKPQTPEEREEIADGIFNEIMNNLSRAFYDSMTLAIEVDGEQKRPWELHTSSV